MAVGTDLRAPDRVRSNTGAAPTTTAGTAGAEGEMHPNFLVETFRKTGQIGPPRRLVSLLLVVFSLSFSWYLIGQQVLGAEFGAIDDHEIVLALTTRDGVHLSYGEMWRKLLDTEFGSLTAGGRYRPIYYLLRLHECWLWGDSVAAWYAARVALLALTIFGFTWSIACFTGLWPAVTLVVLMFTAPYWGDVWARLGTSEIYGAAGLSLVCLGASLELWGNNRSLLYLSLLVGGSIIFCGVKETLLPFSVVPLLVLMFVMWRDGLSRSRIITFLVCAGFALWVAIITYLQVAGRGVDIYANPVSVGGRLGFLKDPALMSHILRDFAGPLLVFLVLLVPPLLSRRTLELKRAAFLSTIYLTYALLVMLILYATQFLLYNGLLPLSNRYDFPAELLRWFAIAAVIGAVAHVYSHWSLDRKVLASFSVATVVLALAVVMYILFGPALPLRTSVAQNISSTKHFSQALNNLVRTARNSPDAPIIFEGQIALSTFEPLFSIRRYLDYYRVPNPAALRFRPAAGESNSPLAKQLVGELSNLQRVGNPSLRLVPLAQVESATRCISVGIDKPPDAQCSLVSFTGN